MAFFIIHFSKKHAKIPVYFLFDCPNFKPYKLITSNNQSKIMAIWTTNNRACTTLWSTLYSMQQLTTNFAESGTLTMNDLTYYNELSSSDQRAHDISMVADQLDNVFINGRGAKYEAGVNHSAAIAGIVGVLSDKTKQVQDLASTADSLYQFWGEV